MSINKVMLIGNVGQDPEIRTLNSGDSVVNLSVATSEKYNNKSTGEVTKKTEWHRCVLFGQNAKFAGQYIVKGAKIYIDGKLQYRKWTDKTGIEKYVTEILVDRLELLSKQLANQDDDAIEDDNIPF